MRSIVDDMISRSAPAVSLQKDGSVYVHLHVNFWPGLRRICSTELPSTAPWSRP